MKNIVLNRLPTPHAVAVGSQIQNLLEKIQFTTTETEELKVYYEPFYEFLDKFILARQQTDLSHVSNHKNDLNRIRICNLSGLKLIAKTYLNSNVQLEIDIARDLLEIIQKYEKDIDGRSYELLSVKIDGITKEIEEKITAENLVLIGAKKWLDDLEEAEVNFSNYLASQSSALFDSTELLTLSDLKNEYLKSLEIFINAIPFLNIKTQSDNYEKLLIGINEIIEKAFTAIKAKAKRLKSDKGAEATDLGSNKDSENEDPIT